MLNVCAGQIYFVYHRHYFKRVIQRQINVCKRLRLYSLRCVYDEHSTFARSKATGNLVIKVNVARCVYQIKHIAFAVGMRIKHPYGGRFYGYAAFALYVHIIKQLRFHVAQRHGIGHFNHPVRQGRFTVVDVRNYAKVSYQFTVVCHAYPSKHYLVK